MSSSTQQPQDHVLVAGGSGALGHRLLECMLVSDQKPRVSCLVRSIDRAKQHLKDHIGFKRIDDVNWIEADVCDRNSLDGKLNGVSIVLSALQGDDRVMLDGQKNLFEECIKAGVKRFVPSDYSIDIFSLHRGFHPKLDQRISFASYVDERLQDKERTIECFHPLNGVFMEQFFSPCLGIYDPKSSTINYYGDANQQIDVTSMNDVARFVAKGALDPNILNELKKRNDIRHLEFEVKGDTVCINDLPKLFKEIKNQELKLNRLGDLDALEKEIENRMQKYPSDHMKFVPLAYQLSVQRGEGRLKCPINDLYNLPVTDLPKFLREKDITKDLLSTCMI